MPALVTYVCELHAGPKRGIGARCVLASRRGLLLLNHQCEERVTSLSIGKVQNAAICGGCDLAVFLRHMGPILQDYGAIDRILILIYHTDMQWAGRGRWLSVSVWA